MAVVRGIEGTCAFFDLIEDLCYSHGQSDILAPQRLDDRSLAKFPQHVAGKQQLDHLTMGCIQAPVSAIATGGRMAAITQVIDEIINGLVFALSGSYACRHGFSAPFQSDGSECLNRG